MPRLDSLLRPLVHCTFFYLPLLCSYSVAQEVPNLPPAAAQAQEEEPRFVREALQGRFCGLPDPIPVAAGNNRRPEVKRNYVEVIYDARSGEIRWYDYASQQRGSTTLARIYNYSLFTPVTYSKERILVRVCGVKFNSTVTINPTSTAIPENTLDIRGVTGATTAAAPGGQSPGGGPPAPTAVAAGAPGPAPLSPDAVEKIAQQAASYFVTYRALERSIAAIGCPNPANMAQCAVNTVPRLQQEAAVLGASLERPDYENQAVFNALFIQTQKLVTDLNNLSAALAAANLQSGIVQLNLSFSTLSTSASPAVLAVVDANNVSNRQKVDTRLQVYLGPGHENDDISQMLANLPPGRLNAEFENLNAQQDLLHSAASVVFTRINDVHDYSRTAVTSVLTPITNGDITVQISVQDNYVPFGFSNASPSVGAGPSSSPNQLQSGMAKPSQPGATQPQGPSPSPSGTPPAGGSPPQHVDAQVQIEVHHKADFNAVAGFAAVKIRQPSFGLTPSGTVFVPYKSQNQSLSLQPMAGLNWYPGGRDFFPGYLGKRRLIPGLLFGTSFMSSSLFMGGANFELVNGLDLYGGIALGTANRLANGVTLGVTQFPSASSPVPTVQNLKSGVFFGFGFDLSVFSTIFK